MTVFLLGCVALLFLVGLVALSVYSPALMQEYDWTEPLFWTLMAAVVLKAGLDIVLCSLVPCLWPRLSRFFRRSHCPKPPCARQP